MTTLPSTLSTLAGALAAAALIAGTAVAAVPMTEVEPATLTRGADVAVPYIENRTTFVDGDLEVPLGGTWATLLGRSGADHLVGVRGKGDRVVTVRRVSPSGAVSDVVAVRRSTDVQLSQNGRRLVVVGHGNGRTAPVTVRSAITGAKQKTRRFAFPEVRGMRGAKVLVSSWDSGTSWWDTRKDTVTRLTARPAGFVDIGNNMLASYTDEPYEGGCTVLSTLSDPGTTLWKSCQERIDAISPDGSRIVTVHLLSDGIGSNEVRVRSVAGTELARYRTRLFFGAIRWEGETTLLVETAGKKTALVRCALTACENATDPVPTKAPRRAQNMTVDMRADSTKPTLS